MMLLLEVRVPLVDHELVELAARMPAKLKVSTGGGKRVLKRLAEQSLPSEMIYHRKQGFEAPMGAWLKSELFNYAEDIINKSRGSISILDTGYLRSKLYEHAKGRQKNSKLLFSSIIMMLWMDRFQ